MPTISRVGCLKITSNPPEKSIDDPPEFSRTPKVLIQQLVVPTYRRAFFENLTGNPDFELEIQGSDSVAGEPTTETNESGFRFVSHKCRSFFGSRFYWQVGMKLPAEYGKGDIVVFNSNPRILSNFRLLIAAKRRGCTLVSWGHYMSHTSGRISSWIRKKITAYFSDLYLVYTSREVAEMVAAGYSESIVYALNNTIDTTDIENACRACVPAGSADQLNGQTLIRRARDFFETSDTKPAPFTLLYCGRILDKSRIDLLFQAFEIINCGSNKSEIPYQLVIVGDGPAKNYLTQEAKRLKLDSQIQWVGALYDQKQLAPWFLEAAAFVFPGAIGLSLNHAMAYGLPVLTHDNPAAHGPEFAYLTPDENGFVFSENDSSALAGTILKVMETRDLQQLSENALDTMYNKITMAKMSRNFIRSLSDIRVIRHSPQGFSES